MACAPRATLCLSLTFCWPPSAAFRHASPTLHNPRQSEAFCVLHRDRSLRRRRSEPLRRARANVPYVGRVRRIRGLRNDPVPGLRGLEVRVSGSGGPVPPHSKNESVRPWRLLGDLVCASLPNSSGSIPARCSGSAALFVVPSVVAAVR
jgi:hypothetical protein